MTRPSPGSGLGANLASIAGAASVAGALGRQLVVDWRGMAELQDKRLNYFTTFYEPIDTLWDVPVVYAGAPGVFDYTTLDEARRPVLRPVAAGELVSEGSPRPEPYLVFEAWHGLERLAPTLTADQRDERYAELMRELKPAADLADAIESFAEQEMRDRFVVAVNIRTGNGQFTSGSGFESRVDQTIFANETRFLSHVLAACDERARNVGAAERRIFVVTDCRWMHDLLMTLPGAFARRVTFPPPGVGHQYADFQAQRYSDRDSVSDTIADMHLMARCDALVYNTTTFNLYPRLVTNGFGGNQEHIERRCRGRWTTLRSRVRARAGRELSRLKRA